MSSNSNITATTAISAKTILGIEDKDYSQILNSYDLEYKQVDYYLQVGEIKNIQGWILHVSTVISQVDEMLERIIPVMIDEKVPFKIAMSKQTCTDLLCGDLGIAQIGKLACIYPETNEQAIQLTKKLISLTHGLKGPYIPTDVLLGNIIYTRYGSFSPILISDINGREEKYIYNSTGQLIKDPYSIPFTLPQGVEWPFGEFAPPFLPELPNTLKGIYKPLSLLKEDVKGNVFKGIYLKKLFNVRKCVIKQGFQNMSSENSGRCIHDRLVWQRELYSDLGKSIPMPEIIDLFIEQGNSYLVMEFIEGKSLYDKLKEINNTQKSWFSLKKKDLSVIINFIIEIIDIIGKLHKQGYVHRDIAPPNFMVNKKGQIYLIDMELSYSLCKQKPDPPFEYGTAGFMSPEQQLILKPTIKEDIYGLGALMLETFTGLTPMKINTYDFQTLHENLIFFISDNEISSLIQACLNLNPEDRPELQEIRNVIINYKNQTLTQTNVYENHIVKVSSNRNKLEEIISLAIAGLITPPTIMQNGLWYSKLTSGSNKIFTRHKEYTRYISLTNGSGGILYVLARANNVGFQIESCVESYNKSWEFINEYFLESPQNISSGLYSGAAGVALALKEGILAGLLNESQKSQFSRLQNYFELFNSNINVANGVAGQGISMLQCSSYLDKKFVEIKLSQYCEIIIENQQKNGSWPFSSLGTENEDQLTISLGQGVPGIVWFLLEYGAAYQNEHSLISAKKALGWLIKKTRLKHVYTNSYKFKGILLTLLKAYEVFKIEEYKNMAERILLRFPKCIVDNNFTQKNGLAGLGELYLEAAKVLNDAEWKNRAEWIADLYIHTFKRNSINSGFWQIEERNAPTADFMTGTTGIIHFLLRCYSPESLGFRLFK